MQIKNFKKANGENVYEFMSYVTASKSRYFDTVRLLDRSYDCTVPILF